MGGLYKKSEIGLAIILVIIIVLFFFGWIINLNQRECRSNKDCGSESYCGSDFSCHTYPTIQKTIVQYNFLIPSIIIGIAMVIAAIIFKWNDIFKKEPEKVEEEYKNIAMEESKEESHEDIKPYYKSNIKTP